MKTSWRAARVAVTAAVLLAMGAGLAFVVDDALGIRTEPAEQMRSAAAVAAPTAPRVAAPRYVDIDAPGSVRIDVALDELRAATAEVEDPAASTAAASLTVVAGSGSADDDTYRLSGSAGALRIDGVSESGAVRGVYDLAAEVRAGRDVAASIGDTVTSRLPFRMVDMGAVGVTPDAAQ